MQKIKPYLPYIAAFVIGGLVIAPYYAIYQLNRELNMAQRISQLEAINYALGPQLNQVLTTRDSQLKAYIDGKTSNQTLIKQKP